MATATGSWGSPAGRRLIDGTMPPRVAVVMVFDDGTTVGTLDATHHVEGATWVLDRVHLRLPQAATTYKSIDRIFVFDPTTGEGLLCAAYVMGGVVPGDVQVPLVTPWPALAWS